MKEVLIKILRRKSQEEPSYWQIFRYTDDCNVPITTALERLNRQENLRARDGLECDPIKWECSCEQGLCGSCAMVVNGEPCLGCHTFLEEAMEKSKTNVITIEPLSKFPVICDLMVDRSILYDGMKQMKLWLEEEAVVNPEKVPFQYEVSQCLICGCCLEVCPNYHAGGNFFGAFTAVSALKVIEQMKNMKEKEERKKEYKKHFYKGCVKSLACQSVCPMNIPTAAVISKANHLSVWKLWNLFGNQ